MKIGDTVKITLVDGEILEGRLVAHERGFYILVDTQGNKLVCRDSSIYGKVIMGDSG